MLGIIDDALAIGFEIRNRLFDDAQIIFERCEQNFPDVKSPCFAKDGADRRLRIEQRFDVGIVFGSAFDAAGGTERGDERVLPLHIAGALEEFNILRIRTRPAAFDKSDAKFIKFLRDANFVIARKREAFRLRSVAEGSVVNLMDMSLVF